MASNIEKGLFKPRILLFLRGFFQHNSHVNAIISENFDFGKLNSTERKEFFTIFNLKRIGILDEDSARDLVVQPVKDYLQFDQYAIKKMLDFSGRNPFYIQLLCHALENYINEKKKQNFVEAEDVSTVILEEAKESAEPIKKDILIKSGEDPPFYDFNIVFLRDWIEEHGRFYGL